MELTPIDVGHYHEVLDRLHNISEQMDQIVYQSLPCDHHAVLKAKVEVALDAIGDAYQICGQALWELEDEEQKQVRKDKVDAERYVKLRQWMSSNVQEGWSEVEKLGAIAAYIDWDIFDKYIDALPKCDVGLCSLPTNPLPQESR